MPQIKIPDSLKKFFRKEGIDDLPRILELLATVSPVIVINTQDFPVQSFPGGKKTIQKATGIAGNVTTIITTPPDKKWLLLQARITLTTDATVADRYAAIVIRDCADAVKFQCTAAVTTASTEATQHFVREVTATGAIVNALGVQILEGGEDMYFIITNGVAGDSYDYFLEYLEIDA